VNDQPQESSPETTHVRTPGDRRLAHPPSDRYRTLTVETPNTDRPTSLARAIAYALVAVIAAAGAITILGGVLAVSAGLVVVAAATGWGVATGLRIGGGANLERSRRTRLALILTTLPVVLGQLGLWLFARYEGGVLGPIDYLAETFGLLVLVQLVVAWIATAASSR
jgi:hypothetical protein